MTAHLDTTGVDIFAGLPGLFRVLVCPDNTRYDLSTPWRAGDHAYASDSRAAIRIHRDAVERHVWEAIPEPLTGPVRRTDARNGRRPGGRPPIAALFRRWAGRHEAGPVALPSVCSPTIPCESCDGTGAIGYGAETLWDCDDCASSGETWNDDPVEIRWGYWLAARYVALLWATGATVYLPSRSAVWQVAPARFTLDDAEGLVNPLGHEGVLRWLGGYRP